MSITGYMSRLPPPPEPAQLAAVVKALKGSKKPVRRRAARPWRPLFVYVGPWVLWLSWSAASLAGFWRLVSLSQQHTHARTHAHTHTHNYTHTHTHTHPQPHPPGDLPGRRHAGRVPRGPRVCVPHRHPRGVDADGPRHLPRHRPAGAADVGGPGLARGALAPGLSPGCARGASGGLLCVRLRPFCPRPSRSPLAPAPHAPPPKQRLGMHGTVFANYAVDQVSLFAWAFAWGWGWAPPACC
jgi:hypothetical protein